jgi:hypothetical protein
MDQTSCAMRDGPDVMREAGVGHLAGVRQAVPGTQVIGPVGCTSPAGRCILEP